MVVTVCFEPVEDGQRVRRTGTCALVLSGLLVEERETVLLLNVLHHGEHAVRFVVQLGAAVDEVSPHLPDGIVLKERCDSLSMTAPVKIRNKSVCLSLSTVPCTGQDTHGYQQMYDLHTSSGIGETGPAASDLLFATGLAFFLVSPFLGPSRMTPSSVSTGIPQANRMRSSSTFGTPTERSAPALCKM